MKEPVSIAPFLGNSDGVAVSGSIPCSSVIDTMDAVVVVLVEFDELVELAETETVDEAVDESVAESVAVVVDSGRPTVVSSWRPSEVLELASVEV